MAFPQFLGEMGRSRASRATRELLVAKLGTRFHLSHAKARDVLLPFMEGIFRAARGRRAKSESKAVAAATARELDLTAEEVAYLLSVEPDSSEVHELLTVPAAQVRPRPTPRSDEPRPSEASRKGGRSAGRRQRQLTEFGS